MSKKNTITPWGKKKQAAKREKRNKVIREAVSGGVISWIIGSAITSTILNIKIKKMQAGVIGNINSLGNSTTNDEAQETSETETGIYTSEFEDTVRELEDIASKFKDMARELEDIERTGGILKEDIKL